MSQPAQQQEVPGVQSAMDPAPDCGEKSYRGSGKLEGKVAVITGDVSQVDLPRNVRSGLRHAIEVLRGVDGISFTFFTSRDVVRHPLVAKIVRAYEAFEQKQDEER